MAPFHIEIWFVLLLMMNILHIFEEIAYEAFKIKETITLRKYLVMSSIIVILSMLTLIVIIIGIEIGYIFGIFVSIFGILNCIVHTVGFITKKTIKGTIAAGFYSGIFLGLVGIFNLIFLIQLLY